MSKFYRYSMSLVLYVGIFTTLIVGICHYLSIKKVPLLPRTDSDVFWQRHTEPSELRESTSINVVEDNANIVEYDFNLSRAEQFPYAAYSFRFSEPVSIDDLVDLTEFQTLSFDVECEPRNILLFKLFTFDDASTKVEDSSTYRSSSIYFTCEQKKQTVLIPLHYLYTPDWWLDKFQLDFSDRTYQLDKVLRFDIANSVKSPTGVVSKVRLSDVHLQGERKGLVLLGFAFSALVLGVSIYFFVRRYTELLVENALEKMKLDRPFLAYQKLSITPPANDTKGVLIAYLAGEYSNPELNIDAAVDAVGISRSKINDMLKQEFGLTFNNYINKLRLSESARLLQESPDVSIAKIAYSIGFNNVSYFNKLFKSKYGCTPKVFKCSELGRRLFEP